MLLLLPIVFPVACGLLLLTGKPKSLKPFTAAVVILNAALVWLALLFAPARFTVIRFTEQLTFSLRLDGLGKLFAGMVSLLWIATTFYAFEYMKHEGRERKFFAFYTMTFGVVIGVAFSENLFTLYLFYEYLTFATLPLVMHAMDDKARYAGHKYLIYMISGGALAFVAMLFMLKYGVSLDFVMGGTLDPGKIAGQENLLRGAFLVALLGFGVKAAIFPLHGWLPSASVAPTPVTALLHAVAVVKSGVFAILRVTYYSFGVDILQGSFAQYTMMTLAIVTIVYGSTMALRTPHLKRRLAYSTVSNLSYILFGASLMSADGFCGGLMHLLFHAVLKITLFFCAGMILYKTHVEYVADLKGFGKRMPVTMACFTIAALGLIGVPPLAAFQSKWVMATAAASLSSPLAVAGIGALVLSELLTALYLFQAINTAYFTPAEAVTQNDDPNRLMTVPVAILSAASLLLAVFSQPIYELLRTFVR